MKKSSVVALVSLALLTSSVVGCSTEAEPAEETYPAPKADAFVPASEQTKRETGVAQWGVTADDANLASIVRGYGANDKLLVELRHQAKIVDDAHVDIEITLSGERGNATMRIGFAGRPGETDEESYVDATILENTFVDAGASKVLERMRVDTGEGDVGAITAGSANEPTVGTGGGSLVSQTITPQEGTGELVARCAGLVRDCGGQVVRRGASTVMNTEACGTLLRTRGVTMLCRAAGGLIGKYLGRLIGAAAGTAVAPGPGTVVGGAVGGVAGQEAGRWLGQEGCRYLTGSNEQIEQQATRDCITAASNAVMDSAQSSPQCRELASSCRP
jgi:hypothetical protein